MQDIIKLNDAVQDTTNWRNYYANLLNSYSNDGTILNGNSESVFRGFKIPIADLKNMIEVYEQSGQNITDIRAYLAKDDTLTADGDIHILLVPVNGDGYDVTGIEATDTSFISDFTTPCPVQCDVTSPLYSNSEE